MLSAELAPSAALLSSTYHHHQHTPATNNNSNHNINTTPNTTTTTTTTNNNSSGTSSTPIVKPQFVASKDDTCLVRYETTASNNTFDKYTATATAATATTMTKQLTTTTTATNAANLAPTVISPTTTVTTTTTTTTTTNDNGASTLETSSSNQTTTSTIKTPTAVQQPQTKVVSSATGGGGASNDASGRSAALERAYVHDVYENCDEPTGPVRPRVAQFLGNLDPGSVVCDVGCGSGRYLTQCNPSICTIGVDRCYRLGKVAHERGGEVAMCDNLELPFRDESFDAVLSLAVVHHFATTERRVRALRELARILRVGGRVVISVWALEQRHRRFESQDVLIPWQPPKNRSCSYSDEEDDDDFLPPYHAYTEDSTNSSRSAGDGDSSSLSSSSPGESCYSFVRRAIQKLAGGRRHAWFLDSWTSKDTKNDSSLDYEDAKDLPIELRRLEDFEDFPDPPLSAGLKSRSLGSILQPPPRQIVRSRSSVPSLGGPLLGPLYNGGDCKSSAAAQFLNAPEATASTLLNDSRHSPTHAALISAASNASNSSSSNGGGVAASGGSVSAGNTLSRRPKLIKQKQSLCEDDNLQQQQQQMSDSLPAFHMISSYNNGTHSVSSSLYMRSGCYAANFHQHQSSSNAASIGGAKDSSGKHSVTSSGLPSFLRKQSSLNEELMACNRLREKERVRKRIQKQTSLNEAFLCRSAMFSKRLQVIREGFTTKIKTSTGSLERMTKTGISKIMHNLKTPTNQTTTTTTESQTTTTSATTPTTQAAHNNNKGLQHGPHYHQHQHQHHHHHHHQQQQQQQAQQSASNGSSSGLFSGHLLLLHKPTTTPGPVTYCNSSSECNTSSICHCSAYQQECAACAADPDSEQSKARRHSRESGSDSSKDSSLQSDTSIESEDSFASVIFIPKPEQQQQQQNYQQHRQHSNSSSSNSSSSNGAQAAAAQVQGATAIVGAVAAAPANAAAATAAGRLPPNSVPTSPLIMPCPPTPAHSPAATQGTVTSPPQTMAAVTAAMAILTPPTKPARFSFEEAHIKEQQQQQQLTKITRQTIKDLPPIPKFRKQQSLQLQRQSFPIVRRASGSTSSGTTCGHKLLSLELFNPATDDLDSDSSEPSSPDSIDSVISAPRSAQLQQQTSSQTAAADDEDFIDDTDEGNSAEALAELIKTNQQQYHKGELQINNSTPNDIILNADSAPLLPAPRETTHQAPQPQQCAEFAEQLTAQLQRELDDKISGAECRSLDGIGDLAEYLDEQQQQQSQRGSSKKRSSGELSALREELRERRLMLANLSTQPSLQQSPSSSNSSLSFTIHEEDEGEEEGEEEEDENERSYTLGLYDHCKISKFNYKRNQPYNLNPETAYLLQDDGDSDTREDDDHEVIPEEDEDAEALEARGGDQLGEGMHEYGQRRRNVNNASSIGNIKTTATTATTMTTTNSEGTSTASSVQQPSHPLQSRTSTESWEHSNSSTNSLDSPSQGGASTHHRYYHVFREGELDALINHHVTSLHIVSSYYERASWCIVAEKVQVWTI